MGLGYKIYEPTLIPYQEEHSHVDNWRLAKRCIQYATFVIAISSAGAIYKPDTDINSDATGTELIAQLVSDFNFKEAFHNRLEELKSSLRENWDAEGALPIEEESYRNAKAMIENTPVFLLKHWHLLPAPNGTLQLSPTKNDIAGISIGIKEFSYAAYVSDDKQISGKEPFDTGSFQAALKQVHRILGYEVLI